MSNTASLGFAIDSSPARTAAIDLDKLTAAAVKTEAATESLASADKELAGSLAGLLNELRAANVALSGIAGTNAQAAASTAAMATAMGKLGTETRRPREETDSLATSVARLRAEYNPLIAVSQRYQSALRDITAAEAAGGISAREANVFRAEAAMNAEKASQALDRNTAGLNKAGAASKGANDNLKQTGTLFQQMSYQGNDAITMLLSGSSLFQVVATQGGQIVQALGDHPGGVTGALSAMGEAALSAATAIGPLKLALGAAGLGVAAYALVSYARMQPLDDLIDAQAKRIKALKEAYGIAAEAADDYGRRSPFSRQRESEQGVKDDKARLAENATDTVGRLFQYERRGASNPQFAEIAEAVAAFRASAEAGAPAFEKLQGAFEAIAQSHVSEAIRDLTGAQAALLQGSVNLERGLKAETSVIDEATRAAQRLKESFAEMRGELAGIVPDLRTEVQKINDAVNGALDYATSSGEVNGVLRMRQVAMQPITNAAMDTLAEERARRAAVGLSDEASAIAEVTARYEKLKLSVAGNADAVAAYEAAQREATATIKEQAAVDIAKKAAQEAKAYNDAARSRMAGVQQTVAGMQLEASSINATTAEAAGLRFEFQALTAARQAAANAKRPVSDEEIAAIEDAGKRVREYTAAIEAAREAKQQMERATSLAADASAFRAGLFMSDGDAAISDTLRGAGIDKDSAFGRQYAEYERLSDRLTEYRDLNREVWQGIGQDIMNGVKPLEAFGNALKGLAGRMLDKSIQTAADGLFGAVFGGAAGTLGAPAGIGQLGTAANPMHVTFGGAAGGIASLLGGGGSGEGGAVGAITKLLNPANSNTASGGGASAYRDAIAAIESRGSGGYAALGPITANGDRAFGRYQVMGNNIGPWSKEALGRSISSSEFMSNPQLQDQIFDKKFGGYVSKFGERGAAQAWFGGPGSVGKNSKTDMLGTSIGSYGDKFEKELAKLPKVGEDAVSSATAFASTASDLTSGLGGTFASLDQEMLKIAGDFTPAFGSALQSVLDAFASSLGNKGGFSGGWLSALAGSITGGMTGAPGGGDAWAGLRSVGANANGTDNWPGGLSWVGEKGPEIVNLPRGAQVVPNDVSRAMMSQPQQAAPISIQVVNNTGVQADAKVERQPDGSLRMTMDKMQADNLSRRGSKSNAAMRNSFGAAPALRNRG